MICGRHILSFLLSCVLLAGCSLLGTEEAPTADRLVPFQTERTNYSPGDSVTATLTNTTEYELGYNLCFATLQRDTDSGWEQTDRDMEGYCLAIQYHLKPGKEATYDYHLPDQLPDGEYRYRTNVGWETDGENGREQSHSEKIYTDVFTVGDR